MQHGYLEVDVSTSSSKGVLVAEDGRFLRRAMRGHVVRRPADGHVEADPEVWWQKLLDAAAELTPGCSPRLRPPGWVPAVRLHLPREPVRERYDQLYDLYRRPYPATREFTHEPVDLTHSQGAS